MHALTVVAAFLGDGAAVTFIGAKLIDRAHPPRLIGVAPSQRPVHRHPSVLRRNNLLLIAR
jgi:hypothetical protein